MSASSSILPSMSVKDRIGDERDAEEPASDANTMVEKNENEVGNGPGHILEPENGLAEDEYPKGMQFFFILLALILSIFMVALDLVCLAPPSDIIMLIQSADYRRNSYPKNHRRLS